MKHIPLTLLIQIRSFLPDLFTLKCHSFELDRDTIELIKEIYMLDEKIYNCQIKSIDIEAIDNMANVEFLFRLCPLLSNLEIKRLININIEIFLREFLDSIQFRTRYFHLLTFHVLVINDEIIRKFDYMIHSKNLLVSDTIKHIYEKLNENFI
ncbi:unnamed protein product [Rotaria sp. Silwood1]|nr:unnamed protein product [Rotaria sp. Silwood1]CAF3522044.1 unnamed protein product [Rotaria sp. Silwood1]CAF4782778.1 unnamed protein product [Rotaria sp. Silwood1]